MKNRNIKFETLLEHASVALGQSADELKEKYKDYPVCLIDCIEKETHEYVIEVRFDNEEATISISFDSENLCNGFLLFLDKNEDENFLIDHLIEMADYNFKKSCFKLPNCFLKINESKHSLTFYLYK